MLGTPVWASNFVPVFNAFLDKYNIKDKKVALFCWHGGGSEGKTFVKFKERLIGNIFWGEVAFEDPLRSDSDNNVLISKQWIKNIIK